MRVFAVQIFPLWDLMKSWGNPQYWGWSTEKGGKMRKDKGNGGRSIWINNFKTLYVKEVKELCLSVKDRGCRQVPRLPRKVPRKVVCERLCVTKLYVTKLCVWQSCVCVTKLCVTNLCVEEFCVTKLCVCVKDRVWRSCVWKSCDKVVCVCDKIVCERVCVMKLCVEE